MGRVIDNATHSIGSASGSEAKRLSLLSTKFSFG